MDFDHLLCHNDFCIELFQNLIKKRPVKMATRIVTLLKIAYKHENYNISRTIG